MKRPGRMLTAGERGGSAVGGRLLAAALYVAGQVSMLVARPPSLKGTTMARTASRTRVGNRRIHPPVQYATVSADTPANGPEAPLASELDDDRMAAARLRARRALADAKGALGGLLDEAASPPPLPRPAVIEHVPTEADALRHALRAYTDHVERLLVTAERDRRTLTETVARLERDLTDLRAEVRTLRATTSVLTSAGPTVADLTGDAAPVRLERGAADLATALSVEEKRESSKGEHGRHASLDSVVEDQRGIADGVQALCLGTASSVPHAHIPAALLARTLAAGAVGQIVSIQPVGGFGRLFELQARLALAAEVGTVELLGYEDVTATFRLNFRRPVAVSTLAAIVETAAERPLAGDATRWAGRTLELTLSGAQR